jgi:hypothetical protein
MKKCVVSFADGSGDYRKKLNRLQESLRRNTDADLLMFTDYKQINSQPHQVIPYKFKAMAINEAAKLGYDLILWCDSPLVAIKPLDGLFYYIEQKGYVFFDNIGHSLGQWTNQKSLDYFGKTREEALNIKMIMACCMGFNLNNLTSANFLDQYISLADELYPGSWQDHRHDQTVASFLIDQLGMNILKGQDTFFAYESHKQVMPISDTVCLLSK